MKTNKKVSYVEWCPTGVKIGINEKPIVVHQKDGDFAPSRINVVMVGNNTAISRVFSERISKKFDLMFSQKSFVHWYLKEGMEESEFVKQEDLAFLEADYTDILHEVSTEREGSKR